MVIWGMRNMSDKKAWFCQECRVLMKIDETGDFCKCPECKSEVWFGDEEKSLSEMTTGDFTEMMAPAVVNKGGGGKRSGKTSNKQKLRRPSTKKLYENLCK